jgi:uncharacterized protein GlcG (DUF336 family)
LKEGKGNIVGAVGVSGSTFEHDRAVAEAGGAVLNK